MPLIFCEIGKEYSVDKLTGKTDIKNRLMELGFNIESKVTIISKNDTNVIVKVKDSRIAINSDIARRIIVK